MDEPTIRSSYTEFYTWSKMGVREKEGSIYMFVLKNCPVNLSA